MRAEAMATRTERRVQKVAASVAPVQMPLAAPLCDPLVKAKQEMGTEVVAGMLEAAKTFDASHIRVRGSAPSR
jgi:hypothetical protein